MFLQKTNSQWTRGQNVDGQEVTWLNGAVQALQHQNGAGTAPEIQAEDHQDAEGQMVVSQKFTLLYIQTQYSYGQTPRIQDNELGVISPMDLEESQTDAGQFVPESHAVDSPELQQMTDVC